jgi:hypothetical protein
MIAKSLGMRVAAAALLCLVGLFPGAVRAACSAALGDAEAGRVIEKLENASFDVIPLGEARVLPFKRQFLASDGADLGWDAFQDARAGALAGLVTVRRKENASPLKTMEDWQQLMANASQTASLVFEATELGNRLSALSGLDSKSRFLYVFNGTAHVEAVVQNLKFTSGASEYRIVKGVATLSNTPPEWQSYRKAVASVMRADGMPPLAWYAGAWSSEIEFSSLIEFDAVACRWTEDTSDYAFRGQAFTTNRVDELLKQIQAVSP